jgi:type IV pilus assembly protein PilW
MLFDLHHSWELPMVKENQKLKRFYGRSLVELMIALTISMLILIALVTLVVANKQTYRLTNDKARLDEEGRLAINLIAFHLRMAGYGALITAKPVDVLKTPFTNFMSPSQVLNYSANPALEAIEGCSGGFVDASSVIYACNNGDDPDGIIIRYVVDANNANLNSSNLPTDCLGQKVIVKPPVVENRFFVATNATTLRSELYCVGNGGSAVNVKKFTASPQPIVENVSDMRISYGVDSDGDQSADAFYSAETISALPAPNWSRVVSAQICLVMKSANNGLTTTQQQYRDCQGTLKTAADRRLYATFSSVITLRSRASGSSL